MSFCDETLQSVEDRLVQLIEAEGPRTGGELQNSLSADAFCLWKATMLSKTLSVRRIGKRYLRLDRRLEGVARLSPSILREFHTYTVVGLASDPEAIEAKAEALAEHVRAVSRQKLELARRVARTVGSEVAARLGSVGENGEGAPFCILLAGDVVYDMAHDTPRPERSTGQMVRGSDLDLVVIVADEVFPGVAQELDDLIYAQKYRFLINPAAREEIDYVVKPLDRVREQALFDSFPKMVACKILSEAVILYGDKTLFEKARSLLVESGAAARLEEMEKTARAERSAAEARLLQTQTLAREGPDAYLFYTAEESIEFE